MLHTTFDLLRREEACRSGYLKLARSLGGVRKYGRKTPIALTAVLDSNGLEDALWCLRATIEPSDRLARIFACNCAERVRHLTNDRRSRDAVAVARKYADGEATEVELDAAESAAWAAARDAARAAARDAAWAAARDAAWAAAMDAAGGAAWAAAESAAESAARDAAGGAARDAARAARVEDFRKLLLEHQP